MSTFDEALSDGIGFDETELFAATEQTLTDGVGFVEYLDQIKAVLAALSDGVGLAETLASDRGVILRDGVGVGDAVVPNWLARFVLTDGVGLGELLLPALPLALTDTVGIAPTQEVQRVVLLLDTLGLSPALLGAAKYGWALADEVGFSDSLAQFLHLSLSDGLGFGETLGALRKTYGLLTDGVGLAETLTPQLVIRATLEDGFDLTVTQAASMIYSGVIEDGIELSAAYLAPDGSFTTWALNTRTAAVTEYQDYRFNSFGRIGNRYVGASEQGLYWLDGDDDAGEDIVARLKGGFLQFGGTHLSRLKAAYIATRGETDFVLRIETGEGVIYDYAVSTRSMRSTKVHMGKGQRARYFSFELISTGADFDLETLEFVPIVVQRRV